MNSVRVQRIGTRASFTADAGELTLAPKTQVVVQTDSGSILCVTTGDVERTVANVTERNRVIRPATPEDVEGWNRCTEIGERALKAAVKATKKLRIAAKVVSAEVPLDSSRIILFYSAENRIDVGKLAKELSARVQGRVELRSVGVREGAGLIGGIGACGGELCCSSFLTRFASVSVRFAKDQGLSLNPGRITGMCGRLKCCLVYEQATYKEMKGYAPKRRDGAYTPKGAGNILDVDTVNRKVLMRLSGGIMETFHIRDIRLADRPLTDEEIRASGPGKEQTILNQRKRRRGDSTGKLSKQAASVLTEEYIWDDTEGSAQITEERAAKPKKKRRRRRKPQNRSGGGQSAKSQQGGGQGQRGAGQQGGGQKGGGGQPSAAADGAPPKKKRRRRRGGRRSGRGGGGSEGGGSQGGGSQGGGAQGGGAQGGGGGE